MLFVTPYVGDRFGNNFTNIPHPAWRYLYSYFISELPTSISVLMLDTAQRNSRQQTRTETARLDVLRSRHAYCIPLSPSKSHHPYPHPRTPVMTSFFTCWLTCWLTCSLKMKNNDLMRCNCQMNGDLLPTNERSRILTRELSSLKVGD